MRGAAKIFDGAQERGGVAGVVKLAVVIENATAKAFVVDSRQPLQCAFAGEQLRMAEGKLAGEPLINFEAHAVIRKRKIAVCGNDEGEIMDQVWRIRSMWPRSRRASSTRVKFICSR